MSTLVMVLIVLLIIVLLLILLPVLGIFLGPLIFIGAGIFLLCLIWVVVSEFLRDKDVVGTLNRNYKSKEIAEQTENLAVDEILEKFSSLKVLDKVAFGKYEWYVMELKEDSALLFATDMVAKKKYIGYSKKISWANSPLRAWLNGDFYENSFSAAEKSIILETPLTNYERVIGEKYQFKTVEGEATKDKIFIFSVDEYKKFREKFPNFIPKNGAIWKSSAYGGWHLRDLDKTDMKPRLGSDIYTTATTGTIAAAYGVRPALWVKIK